jgi:hypothetical protein
VDERTEEGKRMMLIFDFNEMAFTELILSIYPTISAGKIAFEIVKSHKTKSIKMVMLHWHGRRRRRSMIQYPHI